MTLNRTYGCMQAISKCAVKDVAYLEMESSTFERAKHTDRAIPSNGPL